MIERRFVPNDTCQVEIETREDGAPPKIKGYAAVFYVEGEEGTEYELMPGLRERIMPRAFNRALQDKDDVRGLFNHDPNHVLGRTTAKTMRLIKDVKGLRYEIDPPDTSTGRDTAESIRRGDVSGSSFSFTVGKDGQKFKRETLADGSEIDVREIHSVSGLYDVGPVTFPAYGGTSTALRAAHSDLTEVRSAYEAWKQSEADEARKAADLDAKLATLRERAERVSQ